MYLEHFRLRTHPARSPPAAPSRDSRPNSRALCLTGVFGLTARSVSDPGRNQSRKRPPYRFPAAVRDPRRGLLARCHQRCSAEPANYHIPFSRVSRLLNFSLSSMSVGVIDVNGNAPLTRSPPLGGHKGKTP
jgi:hypothetical protein